MNAAIERMEAAAASLIEKAEELCTVNTTWERRARRESLLSRARTYAAAINALKRL